MPVEVILKSKIEGLGAEADIVSVKPGYARNYLLPQQLASPATAASKKQVEDLKRKRAQREAEELNKAQEVAGKLGKLKLNFTLTSGQGQDKVFGSVTAQDIADKVKEAGYEIDRKKIDLPKGIKELGDHEVTVELAHGVQAKLKIEVTVPPPTPEEIAAAKEAAEAIGKKKAPYGKKSGAK